MTEPQEHFPQDKGNFDIVQKKAILAEALGAFSASVLADDMLFRAIGATLRGDETTDNVEPDLRTDFSITPNVKDGKYSLCLVESAEGYAGEVEADSGVVGDMFFGFATMKYVAVCTMEPDDSGKLTIMVDKPFVELALGREVSIDKPSKEEAASLEISVRTVLQGVNDIADYCSQRGVKIVQDEFGSPQLPELIGNTSYKLE